MPRKMWVLFLVLLPFLASPARADMACQAEDRACLIKTLDELAGVVASGLDPALSIWSYGDGQYDTTMVGSHSYAMNGIYQTCLLVCAFDMANLDTCFSLVCRTHEVLPVTAIQELLLDDLSVWPNPSHGSITVEIPGLNAAMSLRLLDVLGRSVIERSLGSGEQKVEINGITAGEYLLEVRTDDARGTRRVVVLP